MASFPLEGKAVLSLSTALRVRMVRESFGSLPEVFRAMLHIAAGADAIRHLTAGLVGETLESARDHLSAGAPQDDGTFGKGSISIHPVARLKPQMFVLSRSPSDASFGCGSLEAVGTQFEDKDKLETNDDTQSEDLSKEKDKVVTNGETQLVIEDKLETSGDTQFEQDDKSETNGDTQLEDDDKLETNGDTQFEDPSKQDKLKTNGDTQFENVVKSETNGDT